MSSLSPTDRRTVKESLRRWMAENDLKMMARYIEQLGGDGGPSASVCALAMQDRRRWGQRLSIIQDGCDEPIERMFAEALLYVLRIKVDTLTYRVRGRTGGEQVM